jgi:hypothetical protein
MERILKWPGSNVFVGFAVPYHFKGVVVYALTMI